MSEKTPDLNELRAKILKEKEAGTLAKPEEQGDDPVNTLAKFEALPIEQQLERMRNKGYTDLDVFKQRHYGGKIDINKLREAAEKDKEGE